MAKINHFQLSEFDSKSKPGSGAYMRISTLLKLDQARESYGESIVIRHGIRLKPDVARIMANHPGAVKNSSHEHGWAADCAPANKDLGSDWAEWERFLNALWNGGFRRFGIMRNTVHVDDDPLRKSQAIWNYTTTAHDIYQKAQEWFAKKIKL